MNLEEEGDRDAGGGEGGVFSRLLYDEVVKLVDTVEEDRVTWTDPCKHYMDRLNALSDNFTRV